MPYDHPNLHHWTISREPFDEHLIGYADHDGHWVMIARLYGHKGDIGGLAHHICTIHNATVHDDVKPHCNEWGCSLRHDERGHHPTCKFADEVTK